MLLVATAGTSLPGETVVRQHHEFRDGGVVLTEYECTQPGMHNQYRRHFNAVDLFNRDCFGSHSLQFAVQTRSWYRRPFLALLGMCETNALHAYRATVGPITRYAWWVKLADKLVSNPYLANTEEDNSSDGEIAQEESA